VGAKKTNGVTKTMKQPDPKLHQIISFAKSALRLLAGGFLCANILISAGVLFILAEILGIAEELV
jgi:hypothetical protein